jgi:nucleoside-diphosphate-sugar epimerase
VPRRLAADLDHILEHTRPLWEELRGNRIFITGGTGFFGCWLLETFTWANERLNLDAQATVLTRDPARFREKAPHLAQDSSVQLHAGDIRNFVFPDGEYSHVIHAATSSATAPKPAEEIDTIVRGTERCLDFAHKAHCRKLLFTSSGAVYGKQPTEISHLEESYLGAPDPMNPASAYGEAKRLAELQCAVAAQAGKFETKIARCFAFVGPYMELNAHFAIGNFLRDHLRGGPIVVKGDGRALRSYLYASDLMIWLWKMLFRAPSGRAFNVGSENAISIGELARTVAALEPAVEFRIEGQPTGVPPARYVPSTGQAQQELGLFEVISLQTALEKTRRWFLEQSSAG